MPLAHSTFVASLLLLAYRVPATSLQTLLFNATPVLCTCCPQAQLPPGQSCLLCLWCTPQGRNARAAPRAPATGRAADVAAHPVPWAGPATAAQPQRCCVAGPDGGVWWRDVGEVAACPAVQHACGPVSSWRVLRARAGSVGRGRQAVGTAASACTIVLATPACCRCCTQQGLPAAAARLAAHQADLLDSPAPQCAPTCPAPPLLLLPYGQAPMRDVADVWSFDLVHHAWRQLAPSPPPRT